MLEVGEGERIDELWLSDGVVFVFPMVVVRWRSAKRRQQHSRVDFFQSIAVRGPPGFSNEAAFKGGLAVQNYFPLPSFLHLLHFHVDLQSTQIFSNYLIFG